MKNRYSDSSKNTFIWNEHFSVTSCFFSVPLFSSFVHFLLIFKLFDVLVYIFQSELTLLLATDERLSFSQQKLLVCGVFVIK